MILSLCQIEEIGAAVIKDFNEFSFMTASNRVRNWSVLPPSINSLTSTSA